MGGQCPCPRRGVPSTPQYEPIVTKGNEALVHHMEVFQCAAGFESFPHFSGPCDSKMKPERLNYCRHVLAAWALGAKVRPRGLRGSQGPLHTCVPTSPRGPMMGAPQGAREAAKRAPPVPPRPVRCHPAPQRRRTFPSLCYFSAKMQKPRAALSVVLISGLAGAEGSVPWVVPGDGGVAAALGCTVGLSSASSTSRGASPESRNVVCTGDELPISRRALF